MNIDYGKFWSNLFDLLIHPIFLLDLECNIINCNQPFAVLIKKEKKDIIGRKCYELMHAMTGPLGECPYQKTLQSQMPQSKIIFDPQAKRWLSVGTSPVLGDGKIVGGLHLVLDITQEKEEAERLLLEERDKLNERVEELNRINAIMIGRETKIIEVKREVNKLLAESGRPPKYQV